MPPLAANILRSPDFLLTIGLLAVVLLAGGAVLYVADAWRKRQDVAPPLDSPLTLQHYAELYEAGELTEAEYQKVKVRLAARLAGRPAGVAGKVDGPSADPAAGNSAFPPPPLPPTL
jgi:hypothetical protein